MNSSEQFLQKEVKVYIDRPLGTSHPKFGYKYPINYGFIKEMISGDGEYLDAYVLGIDKAVKEAHGKCIALIRRINDDDDKLIVSVGGKNYTDEEIKSLTNFQEQYFQSIIIRDN